MRGRGRRAGIALAACLLTLTSLAAPASARKINVHPGKKAIPKAINRADNGDRLRIFKGHYRGGFEIDKRLKLRAAGPGGQPVIDGRCRVKAAITVAHAGVVLRGLKVVGAAEGFGPFPSEVLYSGISSGRAEQLTVKNTCGDAEYGINVFQSGHLEITGNVAKGFTDAGYYVGAISDTGTGALRVDDNSASRNNRGIIVEDSAGGQVQLTDNSLDRNDAPGEGTPAGIFITNSDGVLIQENVATRNGVNGIHLTPESDNNTVIGNTAQQQATDFLNEGAGNCGRDNLFGTSAGTPLVPC